MFCHQGIYIMKVLQSIFYLFHKLHVYTSKVNLKIKKLRQRQQEIKFFTVMCKIPFQL
jgi:hypothetical protein